MLDKTTGGQGLTGKKLADTEHPVDGIEADDAANVGGELNTVPDFKRVANIVSKTDAMETGVVVLDGLETTEDAREEGEVTEIEEENAGVENGGMKYEVAENIQVEKKGVENAETQILVDEYVEDQKTETTTQEVVDPGKSNHKGRDRALKVLTPANPEKGPEIKGTNKAKAAKAKRKDRDKVQDQSKLEALAREATCREAIPMLNKEQGTDSEPGSISQQTQAKDQGDNQGMVSSLEENEQPFFLVSRRKSGRKANHL